MSKITLLIRCVFCLLAVQILPPVSAEAQTDPAYQTRTSQCRHEPPPEPPLPVARKTDSGVRTHGYTADRVMSATVDAGTLEGGDIVVCTEYGNVEIEDSDANQIVLQVRMEASGEGSEQPAREAAHVIGETELHTYIGSRAGRIIVRAWHSTLGFTRPGAQPVLVSVRLQLPARGAYQVRTEAFHGQVSIHRLTLAGALLRGGVGYKLKGIPGYLGSTELDNVALAGGIEIDNLAGLAGIGSAVTPQMAAITAPIVVKARALSSCRISAVTGGSINIAVQPDPDVGVRALGRSNEGTVRVLIYGGDAVAFSDSASFRTSQSFQGPGYDRKPIQVEIRGISGGGNVNIVSMPAAPLTPRARLRS